MCGPEPSPGASARPQGRSRPELRQCGISWAASKQEPAAAQAVLPIKETRMIRKLASGKYRLYSRKKNPKTGKRRNLGTFASRAAAEKHERSVQYFKRH